MLRSLGAVFFVPLFGTLTFAQTSESAPDSWAEPMFVAPDALGMPDLDPGDRGGEAVALHRDFAVLGVPSRNENSGLVRVVYREAGAWQRSLDLVPAEVSAGDHFGQTLALDGDVLAVAAPRDDDVDLNAGAVYLYRRVGAGWLFEQKLTGSGTSALDKFGTSLALDGSTLVVGAPLADLAGAEAGAAWVFQFDGVQWNEVARLVPADVVAGMHFGDAVAVSGSLVAVGAPEDDASAPRSGSAYLFRDLAGTWSEETKLLARDGADRDLFGDGIAVQGEHVVVAASNRGMNGALYAFRPTGSSGAWSQTQRIDPLHVGMVGFGRELRFEGRLLVAAAGQDTVIDGSWQHLGSIVVYELRRNHFVAMQERMGMRETQDTEFAFAIDLEDESLIVGSPRYPESRGHAWLFDGIRDGVGRLQSAGGLRPLESTITSFGSAMATDGTALLVGAPFDATREEQEGSVQFYRWEGGSWRPDGLLRPPNQKPERSFGGAVAVAGDLAVIGASQEGRLGRRSGRAFPYFRVDGAWTRQGDLLGDDTDKFDAFGASAAIAEGRVIVGAPYREVAGTIGGAAYVFEYDGAAFVQLQRLEVFGSETDAEFGMRVAAVGDLLAVAATREDGLAEHSGVVHVYRWDGTQYVEEASLASSVPYGTAHLGRSLDVGPDRIVAGAPDASSEEDYHGAVVVFRFDGTSWYEEAILLQSTQKAWADFGMAVELDGDRILAGSRKGDRVEGQGAVYEYEFDGAAWNLTKTLEPSSLMVGGSEYGRSIVAANGECFVGMSHATNVPSGAVFRFFPQLSMTISPPVASVGDTLPVRVADGRAHGLFAVELVEFEGQPTDGRILHGRFDFKGSWTGSLTIPEELRGKRWAARVRAVDATGQAALSEIVPVFVEGY